MGLIKWILLSLASSLLVLFQSYSFSKLINQKIRFNLLNILVFILGGILVTLNTYNIDNTLRAFISYGIIITAEFIIFRKNLFETIIYGSFCYIMVVITEIILSIIVINTNLINLQIIDQNVKYKIVLSLLMTLPTCLLVNISFIRKLSNGILNILKKSFIMMLVIISFLITIVIIEFKNVENISYTAYISSIIVLLIFSFFFLMILYNERKVIKEIEKTKMLLNFMAEYERKIDEDRINRHEMLNNLLILKSYSNKNTKKFNNTLDDLIEMYSKKSINFKNIHMLPSGLKGIIYYKINAINGKNAHININISKQLSDYLEKMDYKVYASICKIVGIVFDNSIEAVEKCSKKIINFDVYEDNNNVTIEIGNTYKNEVQLEKISHKNYSTKGKNRGLGLYIVKMIVKNNSDISFEQLTNSGMFITKISIKKSR